jgi:pimeloyl-ACP methyl ester carboxylesterase
VHPTPACRRRTRRVAVLLTAAGLAVTGCSALSSPEGDEAPAAGAEATSGPSRPQQAAPAQRTPRPRTPTPRMPPAPDGLQRFYRQHPTWRACANGFECTRVRVPLDYDRPRAGSVALAVSRRPADDTDERVGALLVNPGGPGASGVSFAPTAVARFRPDVLDRYDVVGFDPRGVSRSEGVDCLTDAALDAFVALDPTPDDARAVTAARRRLAAFGRGCLNDSGSLAAHVSTLEAARDLDIIRAALRSPRLHYYGASYGTLLGATYADLFPQRVGAMVLDGAIDPTLSPLRKNLQVAAGFQSALRAYLRHCVSEGGCPLGGSVRAAQQRLLGLLGRIDAEPLPAEPGRPLTVGHAVLGLWLPLYAPELWPTLTGALDSALAGDGGPLMRMADFYASRGPHGYTDNSFEALYAVNCLDHPFAFTAERIRRLLPRFVDASPVFGELFAWGMLGCGDWPVRPDAGLPRIDAPGAPPIVVVGTTGDPATPYQWAVALADQLRSGVLVTHVGNGHTGFGRGSVCVDDAVNDYFADGVVPRDGLRCRSSGSLAPLG